MSDENPNGSLLQKKVRAEKRVKAINLVLVGTAIMIFMTWFVNPLFWLKLVFLIGPLLWLIFHIVPGINLFLLKTNFMKNWGNNQIEKFVRDPKENINYN